ncbi:hypothetical protein BDU57DRAFT_31154 [Ampelomyces quisqualis]|uniref:Uncharacterized protein n=1 Tax=Ampelomyces quisqualis TaxID=50730 RepID=A0A6A5QYX6_AMPQU|nr:hypothetical protein BDU57DRAFT_31154 [Ampelomyces quisqualis]
MQFTTQVIALFSALASTGLAANVFSSFLDANGAQIGSTNFDVGNDGCFAVGRASQVSFSQAGPTENANGPYCLHGFNEGGCPGDGDASQQFQDISVTGRIYQLGQGLNGAGSFRWTLGAC